MSKYENVDTVIEKFSGAIIEAGRGPGDVYQPFAVNAEDYFAYGYEDLGRGKDTHNLLNAIGNIKRAIDCRLDSILHFWGMYSYAKRKNLSFEQRLDLVAQSGMIAPSVLRKINTYRNRAEHDYTSPEYDDVQDFCDIAQLFLGYTDNLLRTEVDADIAFEEMLNGESGLYERVSIGFDRPKSEFKLEIGIPFINEETKEDEITTEILLIPFKDNVDNYLRVIRWWHSLN